MNAGVNIITAIIACSAALMAGFCFGMKSPLLCLLNVFTCICNLIVLYLRMRSDKR